MLIKSLPGELLFLADHMASFLREIQSTNDPIRCHELAQKAEESLAFIIEQAKEAQRDVDALGFE